MGSEAEEEAGENRAAGAVGVTRAAVCARGPGGSGVLQHRPADPHHQRPDGGEGLHCHPGLGTGEQQGSTHGWSRAWRREGGGRREGSAGERLGEADRRFQPGEAELPCKGRVVLQHPDCPAKPQTGRWTLVLSPPCICSLCDRGPSTPLSGS